MKKMGRRVNNLEKDTRGNDSAEIKRKTLCKKTEKTCKEEEEIELNVHAFTCKSDKWVHYKLHSHFL